MIIWRGLGILVPVIALTFFMGVMAIVDRFMKDDDYSKWNYWPKALGAVAAAVAIWFIGRYLNKYSKKPADYPTPENEPRYKHDLFYVPFEYWSLILAAFAVIGYFV